MTQTHFEEVLARFGNDTVVQCKKCGRTQYLKFANGLKNGWSKCCGYTMPIVFHKADIEKSVRSLPISFSEGLRVNVKEPVK